MATITITVQSILTFGEFDTYTLSDTSTVATLKAAINAATGTDSTWYNVNFNEQVLVDTNTLASYGITNGSVLGTGNVIGRLPTLEDRQLAKLNLATLNRTASGNPYDVYDITELPSRYIVNTSTPNPHPDGLLLGRPWAPINGSAQFNGSNYLSVAGSAATAMGTSNLTWECWVYPTSSSGYQVFIDTRTNPLTGGDTTGFYFGTNTNTLNPMYYTNGLQLASTIAMTLNAWNHVALTRNSGTVTLWVNGASGGTKSDTTNLTEQRVFIGGASDGGASTGLLLTGSISNLRMVKGTAVYTAPFTLPTTDFDATQSANVNGNPSAAVTGTQTSLLLNTYYGVDFLKDNSVNNFTITNNNAVTSVTATPF